MEILPRVSTHWGPGPASCRACWALGPVIKQLPPRLCELSHHQVHVNNLNIQNDATK